jgi:FkbM family methyltransferase
VAVEPMPDTFVILKLNATLNKSNVRTLRRAVWKDSKQRIRLKRSVARSGADFVSNYGNVKAETVTIDDLWESLGPFDLVKIDAEGSEDIILQGFHLDKVSPQKEVIIIVEVRPATMTFCLKWLKENSFKILFQEKLLRSHMTLNLIAKKDIITT